MNQEQLICFQRELEFLASDAVEFARRHPESAGLVDPEAGPEADPHVERFINGFALLNAGLQQQLDGQLPEVADALLGSLFPHSQRPLPSMAVVKLSPSAGRIPASEVEIPAGTELVSEEHAGVTCRFRTCCPVAPLSLQVVSAALLSADRSMPVSPSTEEVENVLRLVLRPPHHAESIPTSVDRIRLFLQGGSQTTFPLYECLLERVTGIVCRSTATGQTCGRAGRDLIRPAGFNRAETALPWLPRSADSARVLTEFFHFPQKFLFVDLPGWDDLQASDETDGTAESGVELFVYLDEVPRALAAQISASTFQLNCTPVINAFEQRTEPVRLTHDRSEYRLTGDVRTNDGVEILSVDRVTAVSGTEAVHVREFFAPPNDADGASSTAGPFWRSRRRSGRAAISDVWLAVADPEGHLTEPDTWTLDIRATCLNGDRPAALPWQGNGPRLSVPLYPHLTAECTVAPCVRRSPSLESGSRWRLGSLLALNCLPLIDESAGHRRLKEMLVLHNLNEAPEVISMIGGLTGARIESTVEQVFVNQARSYCQGSLITLQVNSQKYPGNSSYLFCRVLAEFLARACSFNSFCRVQVESADTGALEFSFPAASGEQVLHSLSSARRQPLADAAVFPETV